MAKNSRKQKRSSPSISLLNPAEGRVEKGRIGAPFWERDRFWGLFLVLAIILAYGPVLWAGFIWDDDAMLTANPCIVGPWGVKEIWTLQSSDICPLTLTLLWLEHAMWGLSPMPYHAGNVLLHAAGAVVLWRVLRALQVNGAWMGAALWALHPVQVESVAWISETKNTLSGLFFFLSILFHIKALKGAAARNYGLTFLFAALALASKSSTVMLPVVLLLCAWWVEGRWRPIHLARVAPVFLMSLLAGLASLWTQNQDKFSRAVLEQRSGIERVLTAGHAFWFYLGKLLWPYPLMPVYPRWQTDAVQWLSFLPSLALAALAVALIVWRFGRGRASASLGFAFAYFLVALLPVLGFANISFFRYSFVADHFQYLASAGPLALIGAGAVQFFKSYFANNRGAPLAAGTAALLFLGFLSWHRCWAYESQETLWTDALVKNPNCWVAHNSLGDAFFQRGETDRAIEQYRQALSIDPHAAESLNNLGSAFNREGRVDAAITLYQKALTFDPKDAEAHYNLGIALAQKGVLDAAIREYQKALEIQPLYAEAHNNLGLVLFGLGKMEAAADQYGKALEINPRYAETHYNLGNVLAREGRVDEAIAQEQEALRLNPGSVETHYSLGNVFLQNGQVDNAIEQYRAALKIRPGLVEIHTNLGNALTREGRTREAIEEYQRALEINPDIAEIHNNLGLVLAGEGELDEAALQFQDALRLKPGYQAAQDNLARVRALPGQQRTRK